MKITSHRPYHPNDRDACLALFDDNCPEYFAAREREDYRTFLENGPMGYQVCLHNDTIVGAWGMAANRARKQGRIQWILLAPGTRGKGIGRMMMSHSIDRARELGLTVIQIAASQKSAPFFQRFGAETFSSTTSGWGPGLDRLDMHITLGRKPEFAA